VFVWPVVFLSARNGGGQIFFVANRRAGWGFGFAVAFSCASDF